MLTKIEGILTVKVTDIKKFNIGNGAYRQIQIISKEGIIVLDLFSNNMKSLKFKRGRND